MDKGTIIGLVAAPTLVMAAMMYGGSLLMFINPPSVMIVIGGTAATVIMNERLQFLLGAMKVAMNAVFERGLVLEDVNGRLLELAKKARRDGVLGLEDEKMPSVFMEKALRLVCDGVSVDAMRVTLGADLGSMKRRHERGEEIFRFAASQAPALGMIGTLIGLVQMLKNMSDPSQIGPAMAIALLTTLYGAMIAYLFCNPIAEKLKRRTVEEAIVMKVVMEGFASISVGEHPMLLQEKLNSYLAPKKSKGS